MFEQYVVVSGCCLRRGRVAQVVASPERSGRCSSGLSNTGLGQWIAMVVAVVSARGVPIRVDKGVMRLDTDVSSSEPPDGLMLGISSLGAGVRARIIDRHAGRLCRRGRWGVQAATLGDLLASWHRRAGARAGQARDRRQSVGAGAARCAHARWRHRAI